MLALVILVFSATSGERTTTGAVLSYVKEYLVIYNDKIYLYVNYFDSSNNSENLTISKFDMDGSNDVHEAVETISNIVTNSSNIKLQPSNLIYQNDYLYLAYYNSSNTNIMLKKILNSNFTNISEETVATTNGIIWSNGKYFANIVLASNSNHVIIAYDKDVSDASGTCHYVAYKESDFTIVGSLQQIDNCRGISVTSGPDSNFYLSYHNTSDYNIVIRDVKVNTSDYSLGDVKIISSSSNSKFYFVDIVPNTNKDSFGVLFGTLDQTGNSYDDLYFDQYKP